MKNSSDPFSFSRGFTLVEVLLTLALLVVMAALSWPALSRPWASQRLRRAADLVRAEWIRARVKAMSSGRTYLFRYAPDDGRYLILCSEADDMALDDLAADPLGDPAGGLAELGFGEATERLLPEGITFAAGKTALDSRAAQDSERELMAFGVDAMQPDAAGCADTVRFYPDGTTSTSRVLLKNEHDRSIELVLRGLTGVVTVGDVKTLGEQELP